MVGDDPFGVFLRQTLEAARVSCESLLASPTARTTLAFVATRSDGRKDIAFYRHPGADMLLKPEALPRDALRSCRCLHFGSVSLTREPARSATLEAVRIARDAGALISYDPNLRPPLWEDLGEAREMIWAGMALADLAKLADEEWAFVTGTDDLDAGAERVLAAGPKLCLVTLGERGAYFNDGERRGHEPGFPVAVADTLGAGDAFVGAALSKFLAGGRWEERDESSLREVVRYANAAGALTCTGTGVIPSLPTRAAVESFLSERLP
jgi:fructokinase